VELVWINYGWLDLLGREYVGNHTSATRWSRQRYYVEFGSNLRNLHRGGELWEEKEE